MTSLAPNDLDERGTIRRMNDVNHAIDAWLGDLARAGRTPATRLKYQQVLWALATFLERDGIRDCDRITPDHCRRFLDRWVNASPSTMALGVTVLRGFFAFLVEETVLDHSPAERIKRPRRKRPEELDVVTVSSSDVERLFAAAEGWQEVLCVALLAYMGPRRSAASKVRRRDVDLEQGTIRFREKGGKVILKPLPDELTAILRAADAQRVWASDDDYLIPSRRDPKNRERSAKVIYDTVKKVADRAGVKSHVHALRAAFAVRMDEQYPGRLVAVKELLGHARVETTMVYLRRQDKAREMETVRGLTWGSVFPERRADDEGRCAVRNVNRADGQVAPVAAAAGVSAPLVGAAEGAHLHHPDALGVGSVFPPNADVPPAGFEPAFPTVPHESSDPAVTDTGSLPSVLLAKLETLRLAGKP